MISMDDMGSGSAEEGSTRASSRWNLDERRSERARPLSGAARHNRLGLLPFIALLSLLLCFPQCTDDEPTEPPDNKDTTGVVDTGIDTTTHMYSWQSFEIGEAPSGTLYSVSAIDENNAYAVGEIYMYDTTSTTGKYLKYNAARWDGMKWKLEVISPQRPGIDTNLERQTTLWSVWGERPNNYTFTSANQIVYYDGISTVTDLHFWAKQDSQSCRRSWGNENDRWFYGEAGWITRGEGRTYTKQPRHTTSLISGMCANEDEAWAVAG
jgi:hypothetical protein